MPQKPEISPSMVGAIAIQSPFHACQLINSFALIVIVRTQNGENVMQARLSVCASEDMAAVQSVSAESFPLQVCAHQGKFFPLVLSAHNF